MAFSNKHSYPPVAPAASQVEMAVAAPAVVERHDVGLEQSPEPTAYDIYRYVSDQHRKPHVPEGAPKTVAHVGSFERTAFAFALKIGRLSGYEAEPLLHVAEALRIAVGNARSATKQLSDPACRRNGGTNCARVALFSEITERGNLKIRLQIDTSSEGDFRFDPRGRGVAREERDLLGIVRDVGDLIGVHRTRFGDRPTSYGSFRADLSELILAAHKTIYNIVDEQFDRTNLYEPFIHGPKDRQLLGIEEGRRLALVSRSASIIQDVDTAARTISAFAATFPQIAPEKFVVIHRCMMRGRFGANEVGQKFASLGVVPNAKPGSQAGVKAGGRKYLISSDDIDTAAGVVERALDLFRPGWADGMDFDAIWRDTFMKPTSRHIEADEVDSRGLDGEAPSVH